MAVVVVMMVVVVVMMTGGNVIVVDVHIGNTSLGVFYIIISICADVKTFIFPGNPPGAVARGGEKWYNALMKGGRSHV